MVPMNVFLKVGLNVVLFTSEETDISCAFQDNQSVLQFYFDKLINVGDPQAYFKKNQQVGRSEQTITISPNELYRLLSFVSSRLDDVVHNQSNNAASRELN